MADSICPELLFPRFPRFLHCTVNHVTECVTNRETGARNSLSRNNSSSCRLIALPQLAGRRAQAAAVFHIPVLTARSITYFMLSGRGGGDALEEDLSDSCNSDDSDCPACTEKIFSPLVFLPKWKKKKKKTCPSSPVLRSSDDPRLIVISLSQSDVVIDPAAEPLELVDLEASGRRHIRPTNCSPSSW